MTEEYSREYALHQSAVRAMDAILASYPMTNPSADDWLDTSINADPPTIMDQMVNDLSGHVWTDEAPMIIAAYFEMLFGKLAPDILTHKAINALAQGWTMRALCLMFASRIVRESLKEVP